MPSAQAYLYLLLAAFFVAGCSPAPTVTTFDAHPLEKRLHWNLPAGWTVRYDGDGVRWGSFVSTSGSVINITRFPGNVGDDLANVNRWRGQLGLPPVTSTELTPLEGGRLSWRWTWIENNDNAMAGAITEVNGTSLVFKLTTTKENFRSAKNDFIEILKGTSWE